MSQRKTGVILSYINLAIGTLINILLTPILISYFGDLDYSVYKVMQSFAGPLSMFHFGISTVVTRCILKTDEKSAESVADKRNTIATAMIVSILMSAVVLLAGLLMCAAIPKTYGTTYTSEYVVLAQKIFIVFLLSTVFHMLTDSFSGCIMGHEKYVISACIPILKNVIRILLTITFLCLGLGVLYMAVIDLIYAFATFVLTGAYSILWLKEIPKLTRWDKNLVLDIFMFGFALLLQAVVTQVNNSVDTILLGAFVEEKRIITMYTSALVIFQFFNSLVSDITKFFLPKATKLVSLNASGKELTDFIITPGRWQAVLAVGGIAGFTLFGRGFISIWIGNNYREAYWVTLMLIIPVTIPLVENAAISLLDATLKRIYRSVVLFVMAILNVVLSVFLIQIMGYWGAAMGTVISLFVGHGLLMNVYYAKTFGIQVFRLFREIFRGILPAGVLTSLLTLPLVFLDSSLPFFIIKCSVFLVWYLFFLVLFGFNEDEKAFLVQLMRKLPKRKGA